MTNPSPDTDPQPHPEVVVTEDVWGDAFVSLATKRSVARCPHAWQHPDELRRLVAQARALVVRNRTRVDRALLDAAPALEIVARAGVGLDNIDVDAADFHGVVVVAALGANAQSVAEHTLALALALARDVTGNDRQLRAGHWDRPLGIELHGRTWGVVGLGATGTAVAATAGALGMHIVGYDPYLRPGVLPAGVHERFGDLDDLLVRADIVSLHVPLNEATYEMVSTAFLATMRLGSYLINVSRGGLVNEPALYHALDSGHLAGAGLDVRREEPPAPGAFERCDRVVLSPHVAGLTHESQHRVTTMLAEDLELVLEGNEARYSVGRWAAPSRGDKDSDAHP